MIFYASSYCVEVATLFLETLAVQINFYTRSLEVEPILPWVHGLARQLF